MYFTEHSVAEQVIILNPIHFDEKDISLALPKYD